MTTEQIKKINHDINSSTEVIQSILEMILSGDITQHDQAILKESIKRIGVLRGLFKELVHKGDR